MGLISAKKAAANGAAFLDKYDPGWWKPARIDTSELDLGDGAFCIIGQLNQGDFDPCGYCSRVVRTSMGIDPYEDEGPEEETCNNRIDTGLRIPGFTIEEHKNVTISKEVAVEINSEMLGFTRQGGMSTSYSTLTDAWLKEIDKRRKADADARRRPRRVQRGRG